MTITWTTEQRKLSDLIPWPRNPRKINDTEAKRLVESFDEFGQVETIAIGPANEIYNGHARLRVLAAEHGPDTVVDVRVASRVLTEKEREKLTVYLHKGAAGAWNFDTLLAEFDMGELVEWGFEESELGAIIDDPTKEWRGMPEFEQEDAFGAVHTLKVHFASQDDIKDFANLVKQAVSDATKFIWYPKQEKENLKLYRVKDES